MKWHYPRSPSKPKNVSNSLSLKIMATVFWKRNRTIIVDFMSYETKVNADVYCETFKECQRWLFKIAGGGLCGVLLLHDNE